MTDSKIYTVLKYFDKLAQNRLRKYIRSPYFNVNEPLMLFFDMLMEYINQNDSTRELTKEMIWEKLFSDEPYNDVRFRKLSSDLLKLVEGFIAQQVFEEKPLQKISFLLEGIKSKKLDRLYNSALRKAQMISEVEIEKPASFYYYQFEIQKHIYDLNEAELKRFEKTNVEEVVNNLDFFYLAEKLNWYSKILAQQTVVSHEYKLLFIDEIIEHIKKQEYDKVPLIKIYYLIYQTLTHAESENEQHYHDLKEVLHKYWKTLKLTEAKEAYSVLLNYCTIKANQGKVYFLKEYVELSKELLKTDILWADGELYPWTFRNTILLALRLGEYDWAERFLTDYGHKLSEDLRENAISYNRVLIYFYQKRYREVIPLLQSVEYQDLVYNLSSKSILIAVYYELDEDEALLSLMDSFKTFLNRHKEISETQRTNYHNLMKYTRKLLRLKPGDKKEIEKIKQEMEDDKKVGIASMKWVYEKLAELE
jgi:hypothetical protein